MNDKHRIILVEVSNYIICESEYVINMNNIIIHYIHACIITILLHYEYTHCLLVS